MGKFFMDIRKIIFLSLLCITTQSLLPAYMTVYNLSNWIQDVEVYAGKGGQFRSIGFATIYPRASKAFYSFDPFVRMQWKTNWQEGDDNKDETEYETLIPSPASMLTGTINLFNFGSYGINFDLNGVLPNKRIIPKKGNPMWAIN